MYTLVRRSNCESSRLDRFHIHQVYASAFPPFEPWARSGASYLERHHRSPHGCCCVAVNADAPPTRRHQTPDVVAENSECLVTCEFLYSKNWSDIMGLGQAWCLSTLALISSAYALPAFKETFDDGAVPSIGYSHRQRYVHSAAEANHLEINCRRLELMQIRGRSDGSSQRGKQNLARLENSS